MKTFNNDFIELPKLKQINEESGRKYCREDDLFEKTFPSITTILSVESKEGIEKWRARVGEEEADRVMQLAAERGTNVHEAVEDYIQNKGERKLPMHEKLLFVQLKNIINEHIDNIRVIEGGMMSEHLRAAGTVDCIAEYDGELAIIDWKTSKKPKPRKWIKNYFMQASAYAVMFEENTGIPVKKLVICMASENGESIVYVEDRDRWIGSFIELRDQFEQQQAQHLNS